MALKVLPKIGAGRLRFGMSREAVTACLGEPDDREEEVWSDDTVTEDWLYEESEIRATFYSDESWRLGALTLQKANIHGVEPVGMTEADALQALDAAGVPKIVLADDFDDIGMRDYECSDYELSIWVCDGKVVSVTLFPEDDASGDNPDWPADNDRPGDEA
ncbi:MAG: hypothetical protein AB8G17_05070 [Gammaproteobacteria bacterium]